VELTGGGVAGQSWDYNWGAEDSRAGWVVDWGSGRLKGASRVKTMDKRRL
jgi:hypothetical protein